MSTFMFMSFIKMTIFYVILNECGIYGVGKVTNYQYV